MTQRTVDHVVAAIYAAACFAAVLAPALAVRWTAFRTDVSGVAGRDLLATSTVVGTGHAAVAWTRLRCDERVAVRRSHIWIASLNALVVLALTASLLVLGVLERYADEHQAIASRGLPVVALWTGLQLVAVALAETTGRVVSGGSNPTPNPTAPAAGASSRRSVSSSAVSRPGCGHRHRHGPRQRLPRSELRRSAGRGPTVSKRRPSAGEAQRGEGDPVPSPWRRRDDPIVMIELRDPVDPGEGECQRARR